MNDIWVDRKYWLDALKLIKARSYRLTDTGYEAYVSSHCKYIYLGTHKTTYEAEEAVFNYRANRLISAVEQYGLNIDDSVVFMNKYLAFPSGEIFNLHGALMHGCIDRNGYIHSLFNGRNLQHHRIIASLFCYRPSGKDYVNHIDGDKENNCADNLEWVTRSENSLHSFEYGLQNNISGTPIYSHEEKMYIRDHCFDRHRDVALHLGRNPETVRKYMAKYRKESYYDCN
jgi:hypothetical protein